MLADAHGLAWVAANLAKAWPVSRRHKAIVCSTKQLAALARWVHDM